MRILRDLTLLAAAAAATATVGRPRGRPPLHPKRDLVDDIGQKLRPDLSENAAVYFPTDADFNNITSRYSAWRNPKYIAAIVAAEEKDVETSAKWALSNALRFQVVNTGHNWADYSSVKDTLLIKVDSLDNININTAQSTVTVGPGQQFGQLMAALYAKGKQLPVGTCNCVGVVGAALGGGHGRLQGLHGLLLDSLLSARVLLASGRIVTASATENSDLFWAVRGAGQNFGVTLSMTFRTYDQVNNGMHYNEVLLFEGKSLEKVFEAQNNFARIMPAEASVYILFYYEARVSKPVVMLDFVYAGPEDEGAALFTKAFGSLKKSSIKREVQMLNWGELNNKSALGLPAAFCIRGNIVTTFNYALRTYHTGDMRALWTNWLKFTTDNPQFGASLYLFESYPLQAVRARDWSSTAYPNRDVDIIALPMVSYTDPKDEELANRYIDQNQKVLTAHTGYSKPRVYLNYARGSEGYGSFYGHEQWRKQKLSDLKKKYDPKLNFKEFLPIPTKFPDPAWN